MRFKNLTGFSEESPDQVRANLEVNDNAGALFPVASQFNLLEIPSRQVTPERGVDVYESDRTQLGSFLAT